MTSPTPGRDPIIDVLAKMPLGGEDIAVFLMVFPTTYVLLSGFVDAAVSAAIFGAGLSPLTLAASVASFFVGVNSYFKRRTERRQIERREQLARLEAKGALPEKRGSFMRLLHERRNEIIEAFESEAQLRGVQGELGEFGRPDTAQEDYCLDQLRLENEYWEKGLVSDEHFAQVLDTLISEYRVAKGGRPVAQPQLPLPPAQEQALEE